MFLVNFSHTLFPQPPSCLPVFEGWEQDIYALLNASKLTGMAFLTSITLHKTYLLIALNYCYKIV
jgi:hypothetical protein